MPLSSTTKLGKLSSDEEFENMCTCVLNEIYGNIKFDKYGRRGQSQKGIDIYGRKYDGSLIVAKKMFSNCETYLLKNSGHMHILPENEKELIINFLKQ